MIVVTESGPPDRGHELPAPAQVQRSPNAYSWPPTRATETPAGALHRRRRPKLVEGFAALEHASLNENQTTTCSHSRAQLRLTSKGSLMPASTHSSDGVITKPSSESVAQTIDGLRRLMADRGFTVFNVIDHSGVAGRAGVQIPDSKLVMFGKPAVGAGVMLAAPLAALDIPLKCWSGRTATERCQSVTTHRGSWPGGTTSTAHCVRPSTPLSRSLRHYLVHNLR